jgi:hypothetical protein
MVHVVAIAALESLFGLRSTGAAGMQHKSLEVKERDYVDVASDLLRSA